MRAILRPRESAKTYTHGETPVVALREVDLSLKKESSCPDGTLGMRQVDLAAPLRGHGLPHPGTHMAGWGRSREPGRGQPHPDPPPADRLCLPVFNLLPTLTAVENTALPLMLDGVAPDIAKRKATGLLERVGLGHRLGHYPQQLSGGELQRVGIARAVCHAPLLLLADEPTGNLDSANGADVLELLRDLNRSLGVTVLLATHSTEMAAASQRVLHMVDGRIESGRRVRDSIRPMERDEAPAAIPRPPEPRSLLTLFPNIHSAPDCERKSCAPWPRCWASPWASPWCWRFGWPIRARSAASRRLWKWWPARPRWRSPGRPRSEGRAAAAFGLAGAVRTDQPPSLKAKPRFHSPRGLPSG